MATGRRHSTQEVVSFQIWGWDGGFASDSVCSSYNQAMKKFPFLEFPGAGGTATFDETTILISDCLPGDGWRITSFIYVGRLTGVSPVEALKSVVEFISGELNCGIGYAIGDLLGCYEEADDDPEEPREE